MALYAHDAEADVWDCELSDDDESSLFSALPARLPKQIPGGVPAPANTAVAKQTHAATSAVGESLANGTEPAEQCGASSTTLQTELLVASGNTKQRRLKLTKGDQISWKFRETDGHRVDFSVFFVRVGMSPGDEVKIKPLSRCDEDTGTYVAKGSGELVLMFDNQFSWWTDKLIDFEVTRLRPTDGDGVSPSGAGGHAGLHVEAAAGAARPAVAFNTAQAEASDANSKPQNTLPNGDVGTAQVRQAEPAKRGETAAEKAKRLWEAEAEDARARWRQQEAESTDDDSEETEEEDDVDDGDDVDGDESDQEEEQSTDTDETEPGTDGDAKAGERQQHQQAEQSQEPLRDKAWALAMIEKGKGAEDVGHQAAAVELFESAIAALDALGEPRPKLVTRVERLRQQLAEAPSELAEKPTAAEELGEDVRRRVQMTRAFTALREDITAERPPPQQSEGHSVKSADGDETEFQYAANI